jgi:hypothetical protein
MVGRVFQEGRRVDNLKVAEPQYHYEYLAIHDQRLALIRNYTNWYVIGLCASMAVFWVFMWVALTSVNLPLLVFGGAVASFFVWMAHSVSRTIDLGVVALYPRIVFLEIVLDYHFYRDYLKSRPKGDTERRFIEKCEAITPTTTDELWTQICADFNPKDFPRKRRMFRHYALMALGSLAIYWITIAMIIWNTFQEAR